MHFLDVIDARKICFFFYENKFSICTACTINNYSKIKNDIEWLEKKPAFLFYEAKHLITYYT